MQKTVSNKSFEYSKTFFRHETQYEECVKLWAAITAVEPPQPLNKPRHKTRSHEVVFTKAVSAVTVYLKYADIPEAAHKDSKWKTSKDNLLSHSKSFYKSIYRQLRGTVETVELLFNTRNWTRKML